jgi:AcrR family transcriptional regulator
VTDHTDRRADSARAPLVRAAAQQFAHKPYALVNLEDVVATVEISRGAMYFHFPSKQALAMAVIEEARTAGRQVAAGVMAGRLSGLETLIDLSYAVAVADLGDDMVRAVLYLIESIGRAEGADAARLREAIDAVAGIVRRAADEGDIAAGRSVRDIAHVLVSTYIGVRHTSDLDEPRQFLHDLERTWLLLVPGFVSPERQRYLSQFVRRRTAVAMGKVSAPA